jgi:hypothetical protein
MSTNPDLVRSVCALSERGDHLGLGEFIRADIEFSSAGRPDARIVTGRATPAEDGGR